MYQLQKVKSDLCIIVLGADQNSSCCFKDDVFLVGLDISSVKDVRENYTAVLIKLEFLLKDNMK